LRKVVQVLPYLSCCASIMSSTTARKTFALANDIVNVSPQDEIYVFNAEANKRLNDEAPWKKELSQAAFDAFA
jgi:hypothetical protein